MFGLLTSHQDSSSILLFDGIPCTAGRASSPSAGNLLKLTLPFRAFEPTAGNTPTLLAVPSSYWTDSADCRASIISSSRKHFHTHPPIIGLLNPHLDSSSTLLLDGFHAPPGEHHQHELESCSISPSHVRVTVRASESTSG